MPKARRPVVFRWGGNSEQYRIVNSRDPGLEDITRRLLGRRDYKTDRCLGESFCFNFEIVDSRTGLTADGASITWA